MLLAIIGPLLQDPGEHVSSVITNRFENGVVLINHASDMRHHRVRWLVGVDFQEWVWLARHGFAGAAGRVATLFARSVSFWLIIKLKNTVLDE